MLLLGLDLRLLIGGFSSISELEVRGEGSSFIEFVGLPRGSSGLCCNIVGSMHAPRIDKTIARKVVADRRANIKGKRDTRPLEQNVSGVTRLVRVNSHRIPCRTTRPRTEAVTTRISCPSPFPKLVQPSCRPISTNATSFDDPAT